MIYNMRGDAYHAGPVMLSDVYTSAVGSAKDGVAASQRALYNAYSSLNSSKLDLTGGQVSGQILYKNATIDATMANNNVSSIQWPTTSCIFDKNGNILTRLEAIVNPNGDIANQFYARNYNSSGDMIKQAGISVTVNKSGTVSYAVTEPSKFLAAIGAGSLIKAQRFSVTPSSKTSGGKTSTVTIPSGYKLLIGGPISDYVSGDGRVYVTDKSLSQSGTTVTINYYLYNPVNSTGTLAYSGWILMIKSDVT